MDAVFDSWLERQHEDASVLGADSDVLELHAMPDRSPPQRYLAHFRCPTMIRVGARISRAEAFAVLIQFPDDYLRAVPDARRIVALLAPQNAFHPNCAPPFICTGRIPPGTGLREIVFQVYEILTWQKVTMREDDALNDQACVWARHNAHLFPLETRPLRRRSPEFTFVELESAGDA